VNETTQPPEKLALSAPRVGGEEVYALVLIWSRDEPARVGEVLLIPAGAPGKGWTFGRDGAKLEPRGVHLVRQRPGAQESTGPLGSPRISRTQLHISVAPSGALVVENVGRCPLVHDGEEIARAELLPGGVIELRDELVFLCARRPRALPALSAEDPGGLHPFGQPDASGLVGEGPAIWELRRAITAIARRPVHALILGPSGSGKELVARAIHAQSARRQRQLVARSAATIPEGLVDAELFGQAKNFPNPGSPERPGLVGEADGGTLFLDEFAELPPSLQAHLLRVLDDGEYHRLGDARVRTASLRLIAATNRPEQALKHDVLARLKGRIAVPALDARREDIPLLVAQLIRRQAIGAPALLSQFFPEGDAQAAPRTTPELMTALVRHGYHTHLRELDALLLLASIESRGKYVELTPGVARLLEVSTAAPPPALPDVGSKGSFSPEEQRRLAILRKHRFNATACGRDAEYGGNRQTADLHVRQLLCKALSVAGWDIGRAAGLLSGSGDEDLTGRVRGRIETFLSNLRRRLESREDDEARRRALAEEWKGSAEAVLRVLEALQDGRIRSDGGAHERSADKA
jgi:two-component system nitrogen regulation response regulator GlnG/two-component system response regulator HydG